jgi:membrane-associated phospholipid phosphatase
VPPVYRRAALSFGAAYILFTLIVALGWLRSLDFSLSRAARADLPCWALNAGEAASVPLAGELSLLYVGALALLCLRHGRPLLGGWLIGLLAAIVAVEFLFKFSFYQPGPGALLSGLERPDCYRPAYLTYPLISLPVPNTFPSGHAARTAYFGLLLATVLGARWPRLAGPVRLAIAALVVLLGASRVVVAWHWTSDVLAGLLLGAAAACLALALADGFRWLRPKASSASRLPVSEARTESPLPRTGDG